MTGASPIRTGYHCPPEYATGGRFLRRADYNTPTEGLDSAGSDLGLELGAVGRFSSNCCIGLEQEFLLADEGIVLSNRADEFLDACREAARAAGRDAESFAPECAKSMVEVNTPPVRSCAELGA